MSPSSATSTNDDGAGVTVLYSPDDGVVNASLAGEVGLGGTTSVTFGATRSPFTINLSWDASVATAPASFKAALTSAAQFLESQFFDPVTINIWVGFGEVDGSAMSSGALGQSLTSLRSYSYATLRNALSLDASSLVDNSFTASLPSAAPVTGSFWVTSAQSRALGLSAAISTAADGYVGFSSSAAFTYDGAGGVSSGTYDFNGVAVHELSEIMGRIMLGGAPLGGTSNSYDVLDLMHYSGAGIRDFSSSMPGYASADGGQTSLGQLNTGRGDGGDWASSVGNDAFDAVSSSGVVNSVSGHDIAELDTLGWTTPVASASSLPQLKITSVTTGSSSVVDGAPYTGPVHGIASQYDGSASLADLAIAADTPNWFIHGGGGSDAIAVSSGSNVLDGGAGSNFLVGASGADGGTDTFFTDARGSAVTWNTLVNFHSGDYATLWGFDPNVSTWHWDGISGDQNYAGATLRADVHGTGATDASVTFAGLRMDQAQKLEVASGSVGGNGYLLFHNPGI